MRTSVYLFCILTLMICAGIIYESRVEKVPNNNRAEEVQPARVPAVVLPVEESPKVLPAPEMSSRLWEMRFGEIAGQPEWLQSQEELEELADSIPDTQLHAALNEFFKDQSSASVIVARRLVQRWADESPEAVAQWATRLPDNAFGQTMCRETAVQLAQRDLNTAEAWTQQLPAGENKMAAISSLALEAATQKETTTTISLSSNLPPGIERDNLLTYVAQQWATTDRDSAVAWINQIDDSTLREDMLGKVAINLGAEDPPAATKLITTSMARGAAQENALLNVVRFWAASAPEQAAMYAIQLPEMMLRDAAIENVFDVWRRDDPGAAAVWRANTPSE